MIELLSAGKRYDSGRGVHDISFRVDKGEWVLLVGGSGAGKSTILRMIYGALRPDTGDLIVGPHRMSQVKDSELPLIRRTMGIIDQDLSFVEDRNVLRNVTLVGEVQGWTRKQTKQQALRVLNRVGLHAHLNQRISSLSRGELRRLAIARALVAQPFVLIADEPLIHLDHDSANSIVDLFRDINSQGTSILLATHRTELFTGQPVRQIRIEQGELQEDIA